MPTPAACWISVVFVLTGLCPVVSGADGLPTYILRAEVAADAMADVTVKLEVGGELLVDDEGQPKELPLKVLGEFQYREQFTAWGTDSTDLARATRRYDQAEAHIEVAEESQDRVLPADKQWLVAEVREGRRRSPAPRQPSPAKSSTW